MRLSLQLLRAKIKGFEIESVFCRKMIRKTSGLTRAHWWERKREIGFQTRCHLLAYALIREKNINDVERRVHDKKFWLVSRVSTILKEHSTSKRWSEEELLSILEKRTEK